MSAPPVEPADILAGVPSAGTAVSPESAATRRRIGVGAWLAAAWLVVVVGSALLAPVLPLPDPYASNGDLARQGLFTDGAILGGDTNGRDMLSRVVHGSRASLLISFGAVGIGLVIGGTIGLLAGYFRGRTDRVLTGLFNIMLAFPQLLLALALVAFLQGDPSVAGTQGDKELPIPELSTVQIIIVALGIVAIPLLGRITRANSLTWSQREFVMAARAQGAPNRRIIVREVLPNVVPAMFSIALLSIAVAIIAEGSLSLLGVGVQPPRPSWGSMIVDGRNALRQAPHILFVPVVAVFLTILSLNHVGDAIRERFDVREAKV